MKEDGTIQPAKVTHFTQQGYKINGIIHAGMNDGEEVYSYKDLGIQNILGFEPLPYAAAKARHDHGVRVEEIALGNKNGWQTLKTTGGDGKGSTLLKVVAEHPEFAKWRTVDLEEGEPLKVKTMRFASWLSHSKIQIEDYDCLVLDTQGNEMDVLLGIGKHLQNFRFLSIELSETPVYEGETPAAEVCEWLKENGFTQDTEIQSHNDVFFIRSDIKPSSILEYRGLA